MNETKTSTFPTEYQITAWITLLGLVMAFAMVISTFIFPLEVISLDSPNDPNVLLDAVKSDSKAALIFIAIDTFFIIGYTALFIGMYLITRDIFPMVSLVAIIFGILTSIGDLIENSLLFAFASGVPLGWEPHPLFYVILWLFAFLIDSSSYAAAVLFGLMLVKAFPKGNIKFTVGILFLLYAAIGFLAYIEPIFMLIRSFFFVLGLGIATLTLFREPEITLEDLRLFERNKKSNSENFT